MALGQLGRDPVDGGALPVVGLLPRGEPDGVNHKMVLGGACIGIVHPKPRVPDPDRVSGHDDRSVIDLESIHERAAGAAEVLDPHLVVLYHEERVAPGY